MDLNSGHGFIPRVGEENYKAVSSGVNGTHQGPVDLTGPRVRRRHSLGPGAVRTPASPQACPRRGVD